ncbi:MAG: UDP-N-acetylmuramoyl-L-alanine--D-glutamate ligase [Clostridia bacterium]|nr:UDP-N-acetylmuramoyl-L-alanine--D-glutamate ligase [Clostridia bacterium]
MNYINDKLQAFKDDIKNKKIAVLGVGVSNIPAIEYLVKLGAIVTACDKRDTLDESCDNLKSLDIKFNLGQNYLENLNEYDYILRSPGLKPFLPEIENAINKGVIVTSEIELLLELCPCKVIGVTGSVGKTTTTTLISQFLNEAGYKVWTGGNIGTPLLSKIDEISNTDIVVLELSSFQLMTMKNSPNISVVTNIAENHLDYHRDFNEYINAKANIFKYQSKNDIIIFNLDDEHTSEYINEMDTENILSEKRFFSVNGVVTNGIFVKDDNLISNIQNKEEIICATKEVELPGTHNLLNICAAASAIFHLTGYEPIKKVITTFAGVEHRMELVRNHRNVKWYNDSKATVVASTIAALKSFDNKIILIAGGYDKNLLYDELGGYIIDKVKTLILLGKTAPKISKAVYDEVNNRKISINEICDIVNVDSMEQAVDYANQIASENDIVVLSPASASFDMYKSFEHRGEHFKELVNKLN